MDKPGKRQTLLPSTHDSKEDINSIQLKRNGVNEKMLPILRSFLSNRLLCTALNGSFLDWLNIEAGVPLGSVLGPLLFLIYINGLAEAITSEIRIFTDDTFIFQSIPNSVNFLSVTLDEDLRMRYYKTSCGSYFSYKESNSVLNYLTFNNISVTNVGETKHLGVIF